MDNAMVKRGIGAVVLAVVAALLLGYLLKDKSREREEVVMRLPNAPEMNIPSLTGSLSDASGLNEETPSLLESAKASLQTTANGVSNALEESGSAVVASTSGIVQDAVSNVNNTANTTMDSVSVATQGMKPGFAIRPPVQNEQKEIVDATETSPIDENAPKIEKPSNATKASETIVASSKATTKKPFKPRIVENKPIKKAAVTKAKAKPSVKPKAPVDKTISRTPIGQYSIQLLATSSQSRADKLANTMKNEGYKVFVTQATRENKVLYRVRVGGHANRPAAIKAQETMKRRYQKNFFVQNSLVISN